MLARHYWVMGQWEYRPMVCPGCSLLETTCWGGVGVIVPFANKVGRGQQSPPIPFHSQGASRLGRGSESDRVHGIRYFQHYLKLCRVFLSSASYLYSFAKTNTCRGIAVRRTIKNAALQRRVLRAVAKRPLGPVCRAPTERGYPFIPFVFPPLHPLVFIALKTSGELYRLVTSTSVSASV